MDMLNPHCGIDRDSRGVVRLTICNAGKLNIVSSAVTNGVREGFEHLAADHSIRAVILAGESERSMIGGADIKEMATLDQKSAEGFISRLRDLCEAVRKFPAPVIARLPGWCLGGGLEVAAACDVRVAAHDAMFGMPEVRVGIPSVIHAALLPRLIGKARSVELSLLGERLPAEKALEWGLVNRVYDDAALMEETMKLAHDLANGPTIALSLIRKLYWDSPENTLEDQLNLECESQRIAGRAEDFKEGVTAFLEKRPAKFKGK